jgi:hypothetical protein
MKHRQANERLTREGIRERAYEFQKSRCLLTAFELDVFSVLGDSARSSGEAAGLMKTDVRATDRLLNALCALGLLVKEEQKFRNTDAAREFLVKGTPGYLAGLMHGVHLWDTWSTLTEAVRKGTSVITGDVGQRGEDWRTAFIAAMHDRASRQAHDVIAQIDLRGVRRLLDVGGGSGAYAMAFVKAKRGLRATVFDLPGVIPLTRGYLRAERLLERVSTVMGDYMTDELGSGYDLVFLSAIIHSNSPDENLMLLKKCTGALGAKGRVIVQDFIMDEDRTNPPGGALFALNMLVGTHGGDTYTAAEVRSWMEEAGLSRVKRSETPYGTTHIIGRKIAS